MARTTARKTDSTQCSGCMADVVLDYAKGEVRVGRKSADLVVEADLLSWECPECSYWDSYWPDFGREFADWLK